MTEIWKSILGFEGLYEVSNLGRVRSLDRYLVVSVRGGAIRHKFYKGRVLRPGVDKTSGHLTVVLGRDGGTKNVHVLVAEAFLDKPQGKVEVRHLDDDPSHNHADNLAWGTRAQNLQDLKWNRLGTGKVLSGEAAGLLKADLRAGLSGVLCAAKYGVCQSLVSAIKHGKVHVDVD